MLGARSVRTVDMQAEACFGGKVLSTDAVAFIRRGGRVGDQDHWEPSGNSRRWDRGVFCPGVWQEAVFMARAKLWHVAAQCIPDAGMKGFIIDNRAPL